MEEHTCEICGYIGEDVYYEPDPFTSEIKGDYTPIWECKECRLSSCQEI